MHLPHGSHLCMGERKSNSLGICRMFIVKMPRASSDILPAAALYLIFVLCSTIDVHGVSLAPNKTSFSALLAFGDSIIDTGNNNYIFTLAKCDYPPYGRDFPGGIPSGRFGNGKVFSDLLAEALGIKPLLPPFLDPNLQIDDLETGVSFGSGGSGLREFTHKMQNTLSVLSQIDLFKQYIGKLEDGLGHDNAKATVSDSLVLISMGNNDICLAYFFLSFLYDIDTYTTQLVNAASSFIKELHELGARKFAYLSILPVGELPGPRTIAGGFSRNSVAWLNQGAMKFNSKLENEIKYLNRKLHGTKILYIDVYNPMLDLIENFKNYGFDDSTRGCCGTGLIEVQELCNKFNPFTCSNASTHVFWDAAHPSESSYRILIPDIADKILKQLSV